MKWVEVKNGRAWEGSRVQWTILQRTERGKVSRLPRKGSDIIDVLTDDGRVLRVRAGEVALEHA